MSLSLRQPMLFPTSRRSASLPLPSSVAWGRHVSRYLSWEFESACFQVCVGVFVSVAWKSECAINLDTDVEFCLTAREEAWHGERIHRCVRMCFSVDLVVWFLMSVIRFDPDECVCLQYVCVICVVSEPAGYFSTTAICLWSFSQCQDWTLPLPALFLFSSFSLCHSHLRDDQSGEESVNRLKRWSDGKAKRERRTYCFGCTVISDLTS